MIEPTKDEIKKSAHIFSTKELGNEDEIYEYGFHKGVEWCIGYIKLFE